MIRSVVTQFVFVCIFAVSGVTAAQGATITTSDFLDLQGGIFSPLPTSMPLLEVNVGPVTIPLPPGNSSIFAGAYVVGDPNNPAGRIGLGYFNERSPAIYNLSIPVAGAGITFRHIHTRSERSPAILRAYDGPDGTGNLVGMVSSVPTPPPWGVENRPIDFVAVWSDQVNIRSMVVVGDNPAREFSILGFGITMTPVPEPSSALLAALSIALFPYRRVRPILTTAAE